MASGVYIGIDIGGSGIDAGLCGADGALITRGRTPVVSGAERGDILRDTRLLLRSLISGAGVSNGDVLGIGVGIPGSFDGERGEILYTANMPLGGLNIAEELGCDFAAPVHLENDANCAALGEKQAPGREMIEDMVFVTVGTGIGGGVIAGGEIYRGFNSAAGEIGHMVIERGGRMCACGRRGCWERYASATALTEAAVRLAESGRGAAVRRLCGDDLSRVSAKTPFDAARQGDAAARRLIDEYISYLACGIANLVNILEPQLVCIGGGVSREPDEWLLGPLRDAVYREAYPHGRARTRLESAHFTEDSGIIGAAALCRSKVS
ncbi:MAG: ROK family protein [Oscillospiraceae bacterium]|jgi:glucokinase|nr:ROK family protein [Oscillospiraceae bacterium]